MLTLAEARSAQQLRANNMEITKAGVVDLLTAVKGTTFAHIVHCTDVTLAAKARDEGNTVTKVTRCNVQLFNNIADYKTVYEAAVKRSAERLGISKQADIDNFESQGNWFRHDEDCFSLVWHNDDTLVDEDMKRRYLFFIANGGESVYYHKERDCLVSKLDMGMYLTPSGARALSKPEVWGHSNVQHDVCVRVVKLENVLGIRAVGYELDVQPVKRIRKS